MEIAGLLWRFEPLSDTSDLEQLWTGLETRSDCSFFLTWNWIATWLSETADLSPLLMTVYDGATVVALALFQPKTFHGFLHKTSALLLHQSGDPSTDIITIEYNGILSDRRYTQRVEACIFDFLVGAGIFQAGREVHAGLATDAIADQARKSGLAVRERAHMPSWFVDLDTVRKGGKSYLESLSSNTRHQIRRSMRIYEKRGLLKAIPACSTSEAIAFFEELKLLHQKTWANRGRPGSFATPHFQRFHQALIRRCVEGGRAEIVRVTAGDHLIGLVYNFVHNTRVYAYQTGLSYEDDSRLKPGLVSHLMCIERHLNQGASTYDFLGGHARYKDSLGSKGPDLTHYVIECKTFRSKSVALARRLKIYFRMDRGIQRHLPKRSD